MKRSKNHKLKKILIIVAVALLYAYIGRIERGWWDWLGLLAMVPLFAGLYVGWMAYTEELNEYIKRGGNHGVNKKTPLKGI